MLTGTVFAEGQRLAEENTEALGVEGLDEFLQERSHAGLQYVFTLLAIEYPEGPLLVAFRALRSDDRRLYGTALEYLESILPPTTRQLLWQVVGEQPPSGEPRPAPEVLDDLMKASATVMIRVKGLDGG